MEWRCGEVKKEPGVKKQDLKKIKMED